MASVVGCSIEGARDSGPTSTGLNPGSNATSADADDRASSESPHTNSSQSSGPKPAPSRCAGTVLNAHATRTAGGSRALTCSAADPSATSMSAILPPADVTGTGTPIARVPSLEWGCNPGGSAATGAKGTGRTTT